MIHCNFPCKYVLFDLQNFMTSDRQNKKFVPQYNNKTKTMKEYGSNMFQLGTTHVKKQG
jgi:hypothetical protein